MAALLSGSDMESSRLRIRLTWPEVCARIEGSGVGFIVIGLYAEIFEDSLLRYTLFVPLRHDNFRQCNAQGMPEQRRLLLFVRTTSNLNFAASSLESQTRLSAPFQAKRVSMSLKGSLNSAAPASHGGSAHVQSQVSRFQAMTYNIRRNPTSMWPSLDRAAFLRADYPELACADVYRVLTLCEPDVRRRLVRDTDQYICAPHIGWMKERALGMLSEILDDLGEHTVASYYRDLRARPASTSQQPPKRDTTQTPKTRTDKPRLKRHKYPWQQPRPRNLLQVQQDLASWGLRIDQASFSDDPDVLGVYAQQDFYTQDRLLEAPTYTVTLPRAPERLGYEASALLLRRLVLDLSTRRDFLDSGLGIGEHRLVATLGATIHAVPPDRFSFRCQIEQVQNQLNRSRAVFADARFDFDALFEVYNRLLTNAFTHAPDPRLGTAEYFVGIAPLFSFFNHSCVPNVEWNFARARGGEAGIVLQLRAAKGVRMHDELFISYVQLHLLPEDLEARRTVLRDWIGGECMCVRCAKQDEEEERLATRMGQMSPRTYSAFLDEVDAEEAERKRREKRAMERKEEARRRRESSERKDPQRTGVERKAARRRAKVQRRKGSRSVTRAEEFQAEDGGGRVEQNTSQGDEGMQDDVPEATEGMEGIERSGVGGR